jgi:cell shape-determining protein MreD
MLYSVLGAGLIQAFLELTLYGVYFVVFSTVVYLFSHRTGITKSPMIFVVLAVVLQFFTITAVCGMALIYLRYSLPCCSIG